MADPGHWASRHAKEAEVLMEVAKYGGFSIFWATENQQRAHAIERLIESGAIIRGEDSYPWCAYRIAGRLRDVIHQARQLGKHATRRALAHSLYGLTPSTKGTQNAS